MAAPAISQAELKDALKVALIEVLEERSDLVREMLAELMEEVGLVRAIQEGEGSGPVARDEVFRALEGRA